MEYTALLRRWIPKARAEMPIHFDRRPDHSMHKGIERCARFPFPSSLANLASLAVRPLPSTQQGAELPTTPVFIDGPARGCQ